VVSSWKDRSTWHRRRRDDADARAESVGGLGTTSRGRSERRAPPRTVAHAPWTPDYRRARGSRSSSARSASRACMAWPRHQRHCHAPRITPGAQPPHLDLIQPVHLPVFDAELERWTRTASLKRCKGRPAGSFGASGLVILAKWIKRCT
jgi:hypothetical protein